MILQILAVLLAISPGNLQELYNQNNYNQPNIFDPNVENKLWPVQFHTIQDNNSGTARRYIAKPCSKYHHSHDTNGKEDTWMPTFRVLMSKPLRYDNLKPQSLTNGVTTPEIEYVLKPEYDVENENYIKDPELILSRHINDVEINDFNPNTDTAKNIDETNDQNSRDASTDTVTEIINKNDDDIPSFFLPEKSLTEPNNNENKPQEETDDDASEREITENCKKRDNKKLQNLDEFKGESRRFLTDTSHLINKANHLPTKQHMDEDSNTMNVNDNKSESKIGKNKITPMKIENQNSLQLTAREEVHVIEEPYILKPKRKNLLQNIRDHDIEDFEIDSNPERSADVSSMADTNVMLMKNSRVCYACSTSSNPTCWLPDKRTTVKYCRNGHDSCVTKTYNTGSSLVLIRDCANNCETTSLGYTPKYNSCSVCHTDLCNKNGAHSININYIMILVLLLPIIKYSM